MVFVGRATDVTAALQNVTFEASEAHVGSNVVRLQVRDEPAHFEYLETHDVMWRFDFLYRFVTPYEYYMR